MISTEQIQDVIGTTVYGSGDDKIGKVGQVYLDDVTGQVAWATVQTGLFGTKETFIPLNDAQLSGDRVTVPYSKDKVKDAPNIDVDTHLSESEEAELYRYYGIDSGSGTGTAGYDTTDTTSTTGTAGYAGTTDTGRTDTGTAGDDAMTLSEEQVDVGTERRETGRVRLRKHVVTENVTKTVPVEHEEVRIEREPITDANRGDALSGPDLTEDEHTVTLHEERPVVDKEAVPTERVRLEKDTVTDQATVNETVRKEELDTERDGTNR